MNRRIFLCLTLLITLAAGARLVPQSSDEREFVGTINGTLAVRIKLSQSGTELSGSYAYDRIGKSLWLDTNREVLQRTDSMMRKRGVHLRVFYMRV